MLAAPAWSNPFRSASVVRASLVVLALAARPALDGPSRDLTPLDERKFRLALDLGDLIRALVAHQATSVHG